MKTLVTPSSEQSKQLQALLTAVQNDDTLAVGKIFIRNSSFRTTTFTEDPHGNAVVIAAKKGSLTMLWKLKTENNNITSYRLDQAKQNAQAGHHNDVVRFLDLGS